MSLKPAVYIVLFCLLLLPDLAWAGPSVMSPELSPESAPELSSEPAPAPAGEPKPAPALSEPEQEPVVEDTAPKADPVSIVEESIVETAAPPPVPPAPEPAPAPEENSEPEKEPPPPAQPADAGADQAAGEYRIGAGDVLSISVWQTPDLALELAVLPDGTINFPLVGEIIARDRTVSELTDELSGRLSSYVPDPVLTLGVSRVNSMVVYVTGKVNKPGRFRFQNRIDVLQALALAGGTTPFAKEKQIRIFRQQGEDTHVFDFNYKEVSKGRHMAQNILLRRGDVVIVP